MLGQGLLDVLSGGTVSVLSPRDGRVATRSIDSHCLPLLSENCCPHRNSLFYPTHHILEKILFVRNS